MRGLSGGMRRTHLPSGGELVFNPATNSYRHSDLGKFISLGSAVNSFFPFDNDKIAKVVAEKRNETPEAVLHRWKKVAYMSQIVREHLYARLRGYPPPVQRSFPVEEIKPFLVAGEAMVTRLKLAFDVLLVNELVGSEHHRVATNVDLVLLCKETKRARVCSIRVTGALESDFMFHGFSDPALAPFEHLAAHPKTRQAVSAVLTAYLCAEENLLERRVTNAAWIAQIHESEKTALDNVGGDIACPQLRGLDVGILTIGPGAQTEVDATERDVPPSLVLPQHIGSSATLPMLATAAFEHVTSHLRVDGSATDAAIELL
jgi:hypothetical protein